MAMGDEDDLRGLLSLMYEQRARLERNLAQCRLSIAMLETQLEEHKDG